MDTRRPFTRLRSNTEKQTISQSLAKAQSLGSSQPKRVDPAVAGLNKTPTRIDGGAHRRPVDGGKATPRGFPAAGAVVATSSGASASLPHELQQLRHSWASVALETKQALAAAVAANQRQIDAVAARKRRADELTVIFRADTTQLDAECGAVDARQKALDLARRNLTEAARKAELEVYQLKRRAAVTHERDALAMRQMSSTSRLTVQSARAITGMFLPAGASKPADPLLASRLEFDECTRRAGAAKLLGGELRADCEENERGVAAKAKERSDLASAVEQLQQALATLERNELVVDDAVRHTAHLLRSAGATHHKIPALQRAIRSNETRLAVLQQEREALVQTLMALVEKDDVKIRQLQMACVRSASSNVMPGVVKDLREENEGFQRMCFGLIEDAELERVRLDGTARALAEKLQFVENKIKLKVPSQQQQPQQQPLPQSQW